MLVLLALSHIAVFFLGLSARPIDRGPQLAPWAAVVSPTRTILGPTWTMATIPASVEAVYLTSMPHAGPSPTSSATTPTPTGSPSANVLAMDPSAHWGFLLSIGIASIACALAACFSRAYKAEGEVVAELRSHLEVATAARALMDLFLEEIREFRLAKDIEGAGLRQQVENATARIHDLEEAAVRANDKQAQALLELEALHADLESSNATNQQLRADMRDTYDAAKGYKVRCRTWDFDRMPREAKVTGPFTSIVDTLCLVNQEQEHEGTIRPSARDLAREKRAPPRTASMTGKVERLPDIPLPDELWAEKTGGKHPISNWSGYGIGGGSERRRARHRGGKGKKKDRKRNAAAAKAAAEGSKE